MKEKLNCYLTGVLSVCGVLGIILIGVCIAIFFQSTVNPPHINLNNPTTDTLKVPIVFDTIKGKPILVTLPSTEQQLSQLTFQYDSLRREVEILQKYHQELILDIRQETNNAIEKSNGWLAFWIATSCLVCMALPILIQLLTSYNFKEYMKEAKEEFERSVKLTKEELGKSVKQTKEEFEEAMKNIQTGLDNEALRLKSLQNYSLIQRGLDTKLLKPIESTQEILANLWAECMDYTEKEFNTLVKNDEDSLSKDNKKELIRLLIQMYAYVSEIDASTTHKYGRSIGELKDSIMALYDKCISNEHLSQKTIKSLTTNILKKAKPLIKNLG